MRKKTQPSQPTPSDRRLRIAAVVAIAVLTFIVYWRVTGYGFQYYHDDELYVTNNEHVTGGLSADSVAWAFTSAYAANWHPLTWMSHMLDCQLYGMNGGMHHVTSLLLHIANTLLLLLLLFRMTRCFWKSAFIAAMFALHPLHVESAAWVAERKDVLSAFFMMLTLLAYLRYVKAPRRGGYALVAIMYLLGLLAKPMLVTLPFILLLLDWWPLKRTDKNWRGLVIEKLPLIVLVLGSSIATFIAQRAGGAVQPLEAYPLGERLVTSAIAYATYIVKMLWPTNLAVLYPHPVGGWPAWEIAASVTLLLAVTVIAVRTRKSAPYVLTGWLWYIITLIPVIGLVQVGDQAYADRYTYIPLIGLFIVIAWAAPEILSKIAPEYYTKLLSGTAVVIVIVLSVLSYAQVKVWRNSVTLFEHAIQVVPHSYLAEHELGMGYARDARFAEAVPHVRKAVMMKPNWPAAHFNLAYLLYCNEDYKEAAREASTAVKLGFKSGNPAARDTLKEILRAGSVR